MKCQQLIWCAFLVLALVGFAQAELLVNPGFEDGLEPWSTWGSGSGSGGWSSAYHANILADGTAHGGDTYIEVGFNPPFNPWWGYCYAFQEYPVTEGNTYQSSVWFRNGDANGAPSLIEQGATLTFEWRDAAPADGARGEKLPDGVIHHPVDLTDEWVHHIATEVAPAGAKGVTVIFGARAAFVNVDIDDASFVEVIPPVTIPVDPNSDLAAANDEAKAGDTILFAEGTYAITSQLTVKDGVTYQGAGPGLTIIDGQNLTRAFVGWGDRTYNNTNENINDSGPEDWVMDGITFQNCVSDGNDTFAYAGAAYNMKEDFVDNDADASGGLDIEEADADVDAIRLNGPDGIEQSLDDDNHRFDAMDTDGNGQLSEAELDAQLLNTETEFGDQQRDGGAIFVGNGAVGTIQNCEFLNNHCPYDGDDGGAVSINGPSVVSINDCNFVGNYTEFDDGGALNVAALAVVTVNDSRFQGNYAASKDAIDLDGPDGDGGHIKVQGNAETTLTPGTTLIANRCKFYDGRCEDDGGAIQSSSRGNIVRLDACWFSGNMARDNGTVLQMNNEDLGELTVTNCGFSYNISTGDSDRMIETRRNSKFINCTFVGNNQGDQSIIYNNADIADTDEDGVDDEFEDNTSVVNCLFVNNIIGSGDQILKSRNTAFRITATNCLFFGNTRQDGSDAPNMQNNRVEVNSVEADPLLDETFYPGAGSPAIDAGVDPATFGVELLTDFSGYPRPQGAGYDIGADEQ